MEGNFDVNYSSVHVDLSPLNTEYLQQGEVNPVCCVIKQKTFPSSIFPFFTFHCNIAAKICCITISCAAVLCEIVLKINDICIF